MSTDLELRLREELRQDAERAVLLNPDAPPVPEAHPLAEGPEPRRPVRKLVAVAAAIALIAAAGVVVTRDGDGDRDRKPDVTTQDPMVEAFEDLSAGEAELYTDVSPGSTVELPPPPIGSRDVPTTVWTGDELIVWGGMDADQLTLDDGAAFDLSTGTWRTIAPAPIDPRLFAQVAWTGSEMIVFGGQRAYSGSGGGDFILTDGAAYDPATDTWRTLGDLPANWSGVTSLVWIGDELLAMSEDKMAAFDPTTGGWRPLADPPPGVNWFPGPPLWTGEVLLTTISSINQTTGDTDSTRLVRYDPEVDLWKGMEEIGTDPNVYPELVLVTDADGDVRAVLSEPIGVGAPTQVFDRSGTKIGSLSAIPFDPAERGDLSAATLVWGGEEVLAWSTAFESPGTPGETSEPWALDPATQVWRALAPEQAPPRSVDLTLAAGHGVLIGWGSLTPDEPGTSTGLLYRPPTPAEG